MNACAIVHTIMTSSVLVPAGASSKYGLLDGDTADPEKAHPGEDEASVNVMAEGSAGSKRIRAA
jgi:hypothetical protein